MQNNQDFLNGVLRNLQTGEISDIKTAQVEMRSDLGLQIAAINEKLAGQLISEIEMRGEMEALRKRLDHIERRLDLRD